MADPVEVAIELALLKRATDWARAQSPEVAISVPNVGFTPPPPGPSVKWLRCSFLPVPTATLAVTGGSNQHYGLLQIDALCGVGGGPLASRLAGEMIALFKRETTVSKDGFTAKVWKAPWLAPLLKDDVWQFVPVSIPYIAFAPNPA